jgi:hypothetical protein
MQKRVTGLLITLQQDFARLLYGFLLYLAHPNKQADVAFRKSEVRISSHFGKTAELIVTIAHKSCS